MPVFRQRYPVANDLNPWSIFLLVLCFFAVSGLGLSQNKICLLNGLDGESWKLTMQSEAQNRAPFTSTGVDAFQGNFDAWYPTFGEYLLPVALSNLLGLDPHGPFADTLLYRGYASLLLLATYFVGRTVQLSQAVSLLGAFAATCAALPVLANQLPWFYPLFVLNPHISQTVSISIVIIASFWVIPYVSGIVRIAFCILPALCVVLAILASAPYIVLMLPAIAIYGICSLIDARTWHDNAVRVLSAMLAIVAPLTLGMGDYLYAMTQYTAFNFFSAELEQARSELIFASAWFSTNEFGKVIFIAGFIGSLYAAIFRTGTLRYFAIVHAGGFVLFLTVAVAVIKFGDSYHGPSPVYFETCMWPYTLLFASFAVLTMSHSILKRAKGLTIHLSFMTTRSGIVVALASVSIAIALYDTYSAWSVPQGCVPSFSPIRPTAITETLRKNIALAPGVTFNGISATVTGIAKRPAIEWIDLHGYDGRLWTMTGNDHRAVGLWRYRIPTLFQYFSFITPPYYLLLTDFLSRRQDRQVRSVIALSQIDSSMMRLWGVRYLITDQTDSSGKEIASLEAAGIAPLRLLEFDDVNVGQYSPTRALFAQDFKSGLALLHNAAFDGRVDFVSDITLALNLSPATRSYLVYEKYGFEIHALSPAQSVVVLPIQFSHCWSIVGTPDVQLFRANLMQLGVLFRGKLDGRLVFNFGPIWNSACRLADLADMRTMRISEARDLRYGGHMK